MGIGTQSYPKLPHAGFIRISNDFYMKMQFAMDAAMQHNEPVSSNFHRKLDLARSSSGLFFALR
jgi:hypothetical protein